LALLAGAFFAPKGFAACASFALVARLIGFREDLTGVALAVFTATGAATFFAAASRRASLRHRSVEPAPCADALQTYCAFATEQKRICGILRRQNARSFVEVWRK